MAGLALFISLGGTSYAVTKLPKNSVGTVQVKDGSLTTKDLAKGVVTSGPQGATGPRGPRGAEGPTGSVPLVSALPAGPADGQEVYFQSTPMAAVGVVWHLRYRAAATGPYPWELVGGTPLIFESSSTSETTTSTAYTDLATPGPQLTAPLAGDYLIEFGAGLASSTGVTARVSVDFGPAAPANADNLLLLTNSAGAAAQQSRKLAPKSLPAGQVVKMVYNTDSGTATFQKRWLSIFPRRVG